VVGNLNNRAAAIVAARASLVDPLAVLMG